MPLPPPHARAFVPFAVLLLAIANPAAAAPSFSLEREPSGNIAYFIDGELFTRFIQDDPQTNKCYLWPIIGPHGLAMTRAFPMQDIAGEKQDHPHHRSLFFGLENAGGWNTWHEKASYSKNGRIVQRGPVSRLGRQVCSRVLAAEISPEATSASLVIKIDSLTPDGTLYLEEKRHHLFHLDEISGARVIDIERTLTCPTNSKGLTLVGKKDSGLSLRVAHSLCVDAGQGGRIVNSLGHIDAKAWGKRADWVDFNGPVNGRTVGIAMLNHPDSFRHPTPWHVRSYGLFTANPFALKEVAKEQHPSDVQLASGESITLKHRILLHEGDEKTADIAAAWERYTAGPERP